MYNSEKILFLLEKQKRDLETEIEQENNITHSAKMIISNLKTRERKLKKKVHFLKSDEERVESDANVTSLKGREKKEMHDLKTYLDNEEDLMDDEREILDSYNEIKKIERKILELIDEQIGITQFVDKEPPIVVFNEYKGVLEINRQKDRLEAQKSDLLNRIHALEHSVNKELRNIRVARGKLNKDSEDLLNAEKNVNRAVA